jgi:hypothetical protein
MAMQTAKIAIKGINPLLLNNPQTVDRFNPYAKRMAAINAKKTRRTDDDYKELRELELKAKLYFDDEVGVYIPGRWVMEAIASNGFRVAKLSRDNIRGALFISDEKIKLNYKGMNKVKQSEDVVVNPEFHWVVGMPQGQVRVMKAFPKFSDWSFETMAEYDDKIIDPDSLTSIALHAARYGGFGDFRPTFGRAVAEVTHV